MRFHIIICEIRTKQISDIAVSLMHHYNKIQKYLKNKNFLMTDVKLGMPSYICTFKNMTFLFNRYNKLNY